MTTIERGKSPRTDSFPQSNDNGQDISKQKKFNNEMKFKIKFPDDKFKIFPSFLYFLAYMSVHNLHTNESQLLKTYLIIDTFVQNMST